jgi:hypothetical protein
MNSTIDSKLIGEAWPAVQRFEHPQVYGSVELDLRGEFVVRNIVSFTLRRAKPSLSSSVTLSRAHRVLSSRPSLNRPSSSWSRSTHALPVSLSLYLSL